MKKQGIIFLGIAAAAIAVSVFAGSLFLKSKITRFAQTPLDAAATETVFTVENGQSLNRIADRLEKEQIVSSRTWFKCFVRMRRAETKLQAGEYVLSAADSPQQILDALVKGRVRQYKLTIPEGLNIREISVLVEKAGGCPAESFILLSQDLKFIHTLNLDVPSLEGYLFPDTYYFPKKTGCSTLIKTMVNRFNAVFNDDFKKRCRTLGFSVHDAVTLASIIEKETGDPKERPVISSVFHNRLKKHMRLESDPTVIYGIKNFDGNIKKKHLKMITPYNTYQIKGLPVGPIANPGAAAIKAALYPAKTDFLFFVSKKDTTHYFSKTIKEHVRAVRKYQLGKK